MNILAIDTSGRTASVSCMKDGEIIAEYTLNYNMTHSQTIMPMISEICRIIEIKPSDIDAVAVASGPGSFTGLRIGAATAKGLALGLEIPLVPVPTLDALAYNIFDTQSIICPIMDARRQQVYTSFYKWENKKLKRLTPFVAADINCVLEDALKYNQNVVFLGDAAKVFEEKIKAYDSFFIAPSHIVCQRASAVAQCALERFNDGKSVKGSDFSPFYIRMSQAERELANKNAAGRNANA